ncbi:MAG: homoserine kinase [Bacteroidia bacterium]|nr:homoserine kinase [Bacteroidia bacterium]
MFVHAPATIANLGSGFDIFGLAIREPGDIVEINTNTLGKTRIVRITGDKGKLSRDVEKNTVSVSVLAMLRHLGIIQGFDIILHKKMPLGSGLGSSAASAAAGVFGANELLKRPFTRKELIPFAMEGERMACGTAHADNAAPCLLGGIVLVRSCNPPDIISLPVPGGLYFAVVHPHTEVMTRDARAVLPGEVPLKKAVKQWANTAAFVAALYDGDIEMLGRAMEDQIAEPARAPLIPYFYEAKTAALLNGAVACSISGSGPSAFAMAAGSKHAERAGKAMKAVYRKVGISCDVFISPVNRTGVKKITQR